MTHLWSVASLIVAECIGVTCAILLAHNTTQHWKQHAVAHTHTHRRTYVLTVHHAGPTILDPTIADVVMAFNYIASIGIYIRSCMHANCVSNPGWHDLSASSHVVGMHPHNAMNVCCMFVQLTWCEYRCNHFDHWDVHAWYVLLHHLRDVSLYGNSP